MSNPQSLIFLIIFSSLVMSSNSNSLSTFHNTQPFNQSQNIIDLIVTKLNKTITKINLSSSKVLNLKKHLGPSLSHYDTCVLDDCLGLLDDTIYDLKTAISKLQTSSFDSHDINILLSASMTNQDTCLDGFKTSGAYKYNHNVITFKMAQSVTKSVLNIYNSLSESFDLLQKLPRNIVSFENDEFPHWITENEKKLIQAQMDGMKYNLLVAKDGTGNFTTIGDAVLAAPNSSKTRFVIYIKGGVYVENVDVPKKKTMIMFVGDGIGKTVIKGDRSNVTGWPTFSSATVGVDGDGFIAKSISFVNSAGPNQRQAVAFRSSSHHSAFYHCAFEGYQDTLYVHRGTQFYRECQIYGTVDFICGNAAVIFQNCTLYARKPNPGQSITYTAQSRDSKRDFTGISLINCRITIAPELVQFKRNFKAYLGRPWKEFSTTVIIKSYIDDVVDPAGWLEWDNKPYYDRTLYYGEYMNEGPGSNTTNRVKWPGYRRIQTAREAHQFTVDPFIKGNIWLNTTGIPYNVGL